MGTGILQRIGSSERTAQNAVRAVVAVQILGALVLAVASYHDRTRSAWVSVPQVVEILWSMGVLIAFLTYYGCPLAMIVIAVRSNLTPPQRIGALAVMIACWFAQFLAMVPLIQ